MAPKRNNPGPQQVKYSLSRRRTEDMARRAGLDMGYLGKAIERMRADARQDNK